MKTLSKLTNTTLITLGALALSACGSQTETTSSGTASASGSDLSSQTNTPVRQPRVVGGTSVKSNVYPWMAAIMHRDVSASEGQFCGGSLIADQWILTAAHCIEESRAGEVSVLLGQPNLTGSGGERIDVSRIIEHPDYQRLGYPDLALLELTSKSSANPVSLPTRNNPVAAADELATVIGWGQVSENGKPTNQLLEATLPIVAHNQCKSAYQGFQNIVEDAMICAGTSTGDKDSCYGDSGGPLFVESGQSYVQAGVVSFGKECGLANVPGVYARVSSYHDWISAYADVSSYQGPETLDADTGAPESPTTQPAIDITCKGLNCTMSASNYGNGDYFWDFGDGYSDQGRSVSYPYDTAGEYTVYFGFVSDNGNYQEQSEQIIVTSATDISNPHSTEIPTFTGRLGRRGDQNDLPLDGTAITMSSGTLIANLTVPRNRGFALFLDRYDVETDSWYEVASADSVRGLATIEQPIEAGEYGFTVLSLSRGGRYTLNAKVK